MQKKRKKKYSFITCIVIFGSAFILLWKLAERIGEPENIDNKNPYLTGKPEEKGTEGFYGKYVKRILDRGSLTFQI